MAAKLFGYIAGFVYVVVGVVGFAVTGFHAWVQADTGAYLVALRLNPTHNLVHLVLGAVLMWAGTEPGPVARTAVGLTGGTFLALGVAGSFLTGHPDWNVLALNLADNVLHLLTGAAALVAAVAPPARSTVPSA